LGVALWVELAAVGIRVSVSEPGSVLTGFGEAAGRGRSHGPLPRPIVLAALQALSQPHSTPGDRFAFVRSLLASLLPRWISARLAEKRQKALLLKGT